VNPAACVGNELARSMNQAHDEPSPRPASAPRPGEAQAAFDLRTQLLIVWAHKWVVLATILLVSGGVAYWTLRQPRVYEAVCSIEYDPSPVRPLGTKVEDVASPVMSIFSNREFFETQNRIIGSRAVAERVVTRLGLHRDPEFFGIPADQRASWEGASIEDAAESLRGRVTVEQVRDTRMVLIKVRDNSAERAQRFANAVAAAYIDRATETRTRTTGQAIEFLGAQVDDLEGELRGADEALHHFKSEHDVLSLSMEDRQNLIANEMELLSRSLTEAHVHRIELQSRVTQLRVAVQGDALTGASPAIEAIDAVQELRARLRLKTAERESLRTRYGASHPLMVALDTEITQIEGDLRREVDTVLRASEAELREVQGTERGLQSALSQANTQGIELNRWEMEYGHLVRTRDSKAALYDLVLKRSAEAGLSGMQRIEYVRQIDSALLPRTPVAPRVTMNILVGIIAGIVLGLALAVLLERSDRRIRHAEDLEALGLAVLGIVPRFDGAATSGPKRRRGGGNRNAPFNADLITHLQPMSSVAENLRTIRTNLSFMGADNGLHAFCVTSAAPREGKSTIVINLAISLAQNGKRVLLVDTDMRRPRLHRAFKVASRRGISNALVGEGKVADLAIHTEVPNLDLIPCGPIPPNPSELLHTENFRKFLADAKSQYDHVVFDTPPLGAVTDAAVLTPQLDGVILVVKAQSTTRDAIRASARQLNDINGRIFGAIFNDVDLRSSRYGQGTYYYYRREGYYASEDENDQDGKGGGDADKPAASDA